MTPEAPASSGMAVDHAPTTVWHTRQLVLLTHEPHSDHAVNKLSTLGQIDDIKCWATADAPAHMQAYLVITFRYLADAERVLLPRYDAISRMVIERILDADKECTCETEDCPAGVLGSDLAIIRHHPVPFPDAEVTNPALEGMTRSVVFIDTPGREVPLTNEFQAAVESAWQRVTESMKEDQTPLHQTIIGQSVPLPWRGKPWIIYPGFDLKRSRSTFESVEVARRVIGKMIKEKWGGNWSVVEGKYVSDPITMEEEDDEDEHGHGHIRDLKIVKGWGASKSFI